MFKRLTSSYSFVIIMNMLTNKITDIISINCFSQAVYVAPKLLDKRGAILDHLFKDRAKDNVGSVNIEFSPIGLAMPNPDTMATSVRITMSEVAVNFVDNKEFGEMISYFNNLLQKVMVIGEIDKTIKLLFKVVILFKFSSSEQRDKVIKKFQILDQLKVKGLVASDKVGETQVICNFNIMRNTITLEQEAMQIEFDIFQDIENNKKKAFEVLKSFGDYIENNFNKSIEKMLE